MARGVKGSAVQVAGLPMTSEDIALAEKRVEGKRSPLHEDDFKEIEQDMATRDIMKTEDGRKISRVGNFQAPLVMGHESTLKKFARIEPNYRGWIKVTNEEALLYQELRVMIGHDGDKKLGLIDKDKLEELKLDAKEGLLSDAQMEVLEKLEAIQ